jgi:cyclin-dependent kinase regulatory subunit CKS1
MGIFKSFRHVVLPKNLIKWLPKGLLKPEQWIELGVHQSSGWEHYMIYGNLFSLLFMI